MAQQTYPSPSFSPPSPQYGPPAPPYGAPAPGFGQPPAPRRRTGAIVGAVVAAVLLLGGLAVGALLLFGTRTLNTTEAEREVARVTEEQAGVAPTDISCPEDIKAQAGGTFPCWRTSRSPSPSRRPTATATCRSPATTPSSTSPPSRRR